MIYLPYSILKLTTDLPPSISYTSIKTIEDKVGIVVITSTKTRVVVMVTILQGDIPTSTL